MAENSCNRPIRVECFNMESMSINYRWREIKLTVISISKLYAKSKSLISIRYIHIFYAGAEENGRFFIV